MGAGSQIAWCDHTYNPWWGCQKISPACKNCYAATLDARFAGDAPHWGGPESPRRFFGEKHWNQPLKWNRVAEASGRRARVFCASMADVFEDRPDLVEHRLRLWKLIDVTPHLDWLLLTKRPENIIRMFPSPTDGRPWRDNVWLGTTVEDQEYADQRVPHLLSNPVIVHFLSVEPMLGPVDLSPWFDVECPETGVPLDSVNWVITGCESGHGKRPQNVDWFRSLRDQSKRHRVPFFLKQAEPETQVVPFGAPTRGSRVLQVVSQGPGSWVKGAEGIIEQPYLDGVQHVEFPDRIGLLLRELERSWK